MGLRNSKGHSYDITATVAPDKDLDRKKQVRPLPKIELPLALSSREELAKDEEKSEERDSRIPDWVNVENFKKLLLKTHPDVIDIQSFKAQSAVAAGENYSTFLIRIKISAKFPDEIEKHFSYILKVGHGTQEMKELRQAMNVFTIEKTVYSHVTNELEEMYRQAGMNIKFAPKSYKLDLDDKDIDYILLDDLSVDGFKNANRLECLDMEHTLSVLRKIAQFHAASACRAAKKGSYPSVFTRDFDNQIARAMIDQMFMSFKKPFLDNLKTFENGEKYYNAMTQFFDNIIEQFIRCGKQTSHYFTSLNHGDLWANNILFKYTDEGKLEESMFVDFQNCNWGSPATDLYYFIISSVQIDIKLKHFDYFIRYYHEHLSENLKLLEYNLEIPDLKEFHIQMRDFGFMATVAASLTLGIVLVDPTNSAKFESFIGDSEECNNFKNSLYSNERYRKHINEILPWLYDRGFMEINLK